MNPLAVLLFVIPMPIDHFGLRSILTKSYQPAVYVVQSTSAFNSRWIVEAIDHARQPDWDGEGSIAVADSCVQCAEDLFKDLVVPSLEPEILPIVRGGINFSWERGDDYIFVEIRNDTSVHLYYNIVGIQKWEGVRFADDPTLWEKLSFALSAFSGIHKVFIQGNEQSLPNIPIRAVS